MINKNNWKRRGGIKLIGKSKIKLNNSNNLINWFNRKLSVKDSGTHKIKTNKSGNLDVI